MNATYCVLDGVITVHFDTGISHEYHNGRYTISNGSLTLHIHEGSSALELARITANRFDKDTRIEALRLLHGDATGKAWSP